MPYITDRTKFQKALDLLPPVNNGGELNYLFTKLMIHYWNSQKKESYQTINDILGAVEGAKLEFYRRVATQYEDTKIKQNGDVY